MYTWAHKNVCDSLINDDALCHFFGNKYCFLHSRQFPMFWRCPEFQIKREKQADCKWDLSWTKKRARVEGVKKQSFAYWFLRFSRISRSVIRTTRKPGSEMQRQPSVEQTWRSCAKAVLLKTPRHFWGDKERNFLLMRKLLFEHYCWKIDRHI